MAQFQRYFTIEKIQQHKKIVAKISSITKIKVKTITKHKHKHNSESTPNIGAGNNNKPVLVP